MDGCIIEEHSHAHVNVFFIYVYLVLIKPKQKPYWKIQNGNGMNKTNKGNPDLTVTPLLLTIIFITGIHWLILVLRIPVLDALPYWKYMLHVTPIIPWWVVLAFAALGLAGILSFSKINNGIKLVALILLGTVLQLSFAYSKGQGVDGIRNRIVELGHAEFANVAAKQPDILQALQDYETLAKKKRYGYIPSKPPGTLLFYMLTDRVSNFFSPAVIGSPERLENLRTFASFSWPVISYAVVIPLFFLARELFKNSQTAITASLLYITIPSVNLITLHTDQVIYPFLAVVSVWTAVVAFRKGSVWFAALSGLCFYVAVYFSFGLAMIGFLLPVPAFFALPDNSFRPYVYSLKYGGTILIAVLLSNVLAYSLLNYDIVNRYTLAISHHLRWKGWENNIGTYLRAGITDVVEFSVWIGLPLTILFFMCICVSIHQLFVIRSPNVASFYNAALVGIFIFLLAFGKTKAETARLWLFLVPFICISVANFINRQSWTSRSKTVCTIMILLLEFGTTYFTLHYQDFS